MVNRAVTLLSGIATGCGLDPAWQGSQLNPEAESRNRASMRRLCGANAA